MLGAGPLPFSWPFLSLCQRAALKATVVTCCAVSTGAIGLVQLCTIAVVVAGVNRSLSIDRCCRVHLAINSVLVLPSVSMPLDKCTSEEASSCVPLSGQDTSTSTTPRPRRGGRASSRPTRSATTRSRCSGSSRARTPPSASTRRLGDAGAAAVTGVEDVINLAGHGA